MFAARGGFFASQGPVIVTGGTLTYDGDYSVRSFTANGASTLSISGGSLNIEYLIVGGGAQGSTDIGTQNGVGGGGGGQVLTGFITLAPTSYGVVVGRGNNQDGVSSIDTVGSAAKGQQGAAGSGIGGADGSGTYTGGNPGSTLSGGGGAGASQNGSNAASSAVGGAGGTGVTSSITGTSVVYGSGGGGGGRDGGGAGGTNGGTGGDSGTAATVGVVNTGGGGGGAYQSSSPANGGTGIVVIRYLTAGTL